MLLRPTQLVQLLNSTPLGEVIWLETGKVPTRDSDGKINGVVAFAIDITAQRRVREFLSDSLKQLTEAADAYREYVKAYAQDAKVEEANRRIEVLKDLARYQGLVDQEGQRKAFDAQFQIAVIVASRLSNPVKAIIEYRKVAANWPKTHLADDALFEAARPGGFEDRDPADVERVDSGEAQEICAPETVT